MDLLILSVQHSFVVKLAFFFFFFVLIPLLTRFPESLQPVALKLWAITRH